MIERYSTEEMKELWSDDYKFNLWTIIEKEFYFALTGQEIKVGAPSKEAVERFEKFTNHEMNAFIEALQSQAPFNDLHLGLTSSDVMDTALAIQLNKASSLIIGSLQALLITLKNLSIKYRQAPCLGRTHGVWAEPTTFGLKLLYAHEEMRRNLKRLELAKENISVGKLSGPVGTYANVDPEVEKTVLTKLGLTAAPVATQIVCRDSHSEYMFTLAQLATSIERISVEMRHLSRSEVGEVQEFFSEKQKGSSAMPHKKNPIGFENLSGLARVIRGYCSTALENQLLWHERDISNSSVERIIFPDATTLLHFMLIKLNKLLSSMVAYPEIMLKNLENSNGLIFSGTVLCALIRKDLSRQDAYSTVQECSAGDFYANLLNKKVLSEDELKDCFNLNRALRNIDSIFDRVLV